MSARTDFPLDETQHVAMCAEIDRLRAVNQRLEATLDSTQFWSEATTEQLELTYKARDEALAKLAETRDAYVEARAQNVEARQEAWAIIDDLRALNAELTATNDRYCYEIMSLEEELELRTEDLATDRNALRAAILKVKRSIADWRAGGPMTHPRSLYELMKLVPDDEWNPTQ